jgi:hypothetical protein
VPLDDTIAEETMPVSEPQTEPQDSPEIVEEPSTDMHLDADIDIDSPSSPPHQEPIVVPKPKCPVSPIPIDIDDDEPIVPIMQDELKVNSAEDKVPEPLIEERLYIRDWDLNSKDIVLEPPVIEPPKPPPKKIVKSSKPVPSKVREEPNLVHVFDEVDEPSTTETNSKKRYKFSSNGTFVGNA